MAKKNETAGAPVPATIEEALGALAAEQAKNKALEAELEDAAKVLAKIPSSEASFAKLNEENVTLIKDVDLLKTTNESLKSELSDAAKVVAELKEKLADGKSKDLTVKVGGKKYAVQGGFREKGKTFTKEDIAADAKIAEELIKKGSQLLTEIK